MSDTFFQDLDAGVEAFLKDRVDEPYRYKATDLVVHQAFSLPIPCLAGSLVKYSFSTKIGDIAFATTFYPQGKMTDGVKISEMDRVPSDAETIFGSYRCDKDGTFVLDFDNSFSWFNPKLLAYSIELYQVL